VNHAVVLDTNVFTARLNPRSPLLPLYDRHLIGARMVISAQTVAEARYGALKAGWREKRLAQLERLVRRGQVVAPDDRTVWAFAQLRFRCRLDGHPLHQKQHVGDLWIAATAVRWQLPLVAHDGVFDGCPDLDLRTELH
jgi:predicted nucleic acid-binding protein